METRKYWRRDSVVLMMDRITKKTAEAGCWDKIPSKDNKQGSLQAMQ